MGQRELPEDSGWLHTILSSMVSLTRHGLVIFIIFEKVHLYHLWIGTPLSSLKRYTFIIFEEVLFCHPWKGTPLSFLKRYTFIIFEKVHLYNLWKGTPLSWKGFTICRHYKTINKLISEHFQTQIDGQLSLRKHNFMI